jgi:hypothetical protein
VLVYLSLILLEAHLVFLGIWLRVFMVHGWDLVFIDVLKSLISERGWWLRSCEGYYTCSWLHIPIWHMTRERHTCLELRLCMRMHAQGTVIVWIQWQVTDLCERSYWGSEVFKWKETLVLEGIHRLHNR